MKELRQALKETTDFIRSKVKTKPDIAIILGTGLGALAGKIKDKKEINYSAIPHFPVSTVVGHKGALMFGDLAGKRVVAMEGRFHYYEGYSLQEVTYPVRVMRSLGAKILIVSNAAGGMNPLHNVGELMLIVDHINLMGVNPLIGPNDDALGPRFPDMCEPYDNGLIKLACDVAQDEKIKLNTGVYVGVSGPNLETKAEYRFLRMIGADVVGMSTVPEVIVGVHSGFRILGISCITDKCLPDALKPASIEEILKAAAHSEPHLAKLIIGVIERLKL